MCREVGVVFTLIQREPPHPSLTLDPLVQNNPNPAPGHPPLGKDSQRSPWTQKRLEEIEPGHFHSPIGEGV